MNESTPGIARQLGYAGLLPFIACAVLAWFEGPVDPFFVFHVFIVYSILIFAFLCGTLWGFAFAAQDNSTRNALFIASSGFILVLWIVLVFFQNQWTVAFLGVCYLLLYGGERICKGLPVNNDYRRMRLILTAIVLLCHVSVFLAM